MDGDMFEKGEAYCIRQATGVVKGTLTDWRTDHYAHPIVLELDAGEGPVLIPWASVLAMWKQDGQEQALPCRVCESRTEQWAPAAPFSRRVLHVGVVEAP